MLRPPVQNVEACRNLFLIFFPFEMSLFSEIFHKMLLFTFVPTNAVTLCCRHFDTSCSL